MEIKEGLNTPYIKLDKENCVLTFMGKSYPEHPDTFYDPIVKEVAECKESLTNSKITINIALEILNSVSTKYLFHLVKGLYESAMGTEVNWYYEEDDEDMLEAGEDYQAIIDLPFKMIEVEEL